MLSWSRTPLIVLCPVRHWPSLVQYVIARLWSRTLFPIPCPWLPVPGYSCPWSPVPGYSCPGYSCPWLLLPWLLAPLVNGCVLGYWPSVDTVVFGLPQSTQSTPLSSLWPVPAKLGFLPKGLTTPWTGSTVANSDRYGQADTG